MAIGSFRVKTGQYDDFELDTLPGGRRGVDDERKWQALLHAGEIDLDAIAFAANEELPSLAWCEGEEPVCAVGEIGDFLTPLTEVRYNPEGIAFFVARKRSPGHLVMVKSLSGGANREARDAFWREAKLLAALDHPVIPAVSGLFRDRNGDCFMTLRMVCGMPLSAYLRNLCRCYQSEDRSWIRRFETRSMLRRLLMFMRICDGIAYAHYKLVPHGALNLDNLAAANHREVYILNWAAAAEEGNTADAMREDVAALGRILFELVYLESFTQGAVAASRFGAKVDSELAAIVRKAVASEAKERYESAQRLLDDLNHYCRDEETGALPDSPWRRLGRRVRRSRWLGAWWVSGAAVLVALGVSWGIWAAMR